MSVEGNSSSTCLFNIGPFILLPTKNKQTNKIYTFRYNSLNQGSKKSEARQRQQHLFVRHILWSDDWKWRCIRDLGFSFKGAQMSIRHLRARTFLFSYSCHGQSLSHLSPGVCSWLYIIVCWFDLGRAPTYLQPHYGNGVFGNFYLLALDNTKR